MRFWNLLLDPLMWSGSIEVLDNIGVEHPLELHLMQDEHMVEALPAHTSQKAFTDRIRSRGVIRGVENLDTTRVRNTCEGRPKLAIVIPQKVFRPLSIRRGFPKLLCGPSVGGIACHADMDHSPRVQFDDEESEKRTEEEVSDWETRRRPRYLWHGCAERSSSSGHLVESYAPVSDISGSNVC